jgi:hypothetical protein
MQRGEFTNLDEKKHQERIDESEEYLRNNPPEPVSSNLYSE